MEEAVEVSTQSRAEDDGRVHPVVGAILVSSSGTPISSACRGKHTPGHHAEQEALFGLGDDVVAGCTVYSTLEPCTVRGTQMPCCHRLLDRRVSEVVIGILDPNRDIRGHIDCGPNRVIASSCSSAEIAPIFRRPRFPSTLIKRTVGGRCPPYGSAPIRIRQNLSSSLLASARI